MHCVTLHEDVLSNVSASARTQVKQPASTRIIQENKVPHIGTYLDASNLAINCLQGERPGAAAACEGGH